VLGDAHSAVTKWICIRTSIATNSRKAFWGKALCP
jgi:hypothetical protein